jgi:hypothetical protein
MTSPGATVNRPVNWPALRFGPCRRYTYTEPEAADAAILSDRCHGRAKLTLLAVEYAILVE